jgi:hypothetical protein
MGLSLEPFEKAINEIGALSGLLKSLESTDKAARSKAIEKMYEIFKNIMNLESKRVSEENKEIAIEEVKAKIRAVIGIEELVEMRGEIIKGSLEYLRQNA